ncbi:MAG: ATP-binding protein [Chitinophagales bacterium]
MCKCVCTFYLDNNNVIIDVEDYYDLKINDNEFVGLNFFKTFDINISSKVKTYLSDNSISTYIIHQDFNVNKTNLRGFYLVQNNVNHLFNEVSFYHHDTEYLKLLPRNKKYLYLNCQSVYTLPSVQEIIDEKAKTEERLIDFINAIEDKSITVDEEQFKVSKNVELKKEVFSFTLKNNTGSVYELESNILKSKNSDKENTPAVSFAKIQSQKRNVEIQTTNHAYETTSQQILDSSSSYIYVYDLIEKRITYSNFKHRKYLGYYEDEWNTFDLEESSNPSIQELKVKALKLNGEEKIDADVNYFSAIESKSYWLNVCKKVFKRDAEGNPTQMITFTNDITAEVGQRKFYKTAYEYKNALINAIPEIVLVVNTEGFYLNVFKGNNTTDYRPNMDIVGKHVTDVLPEKEAAIVLEKLRNAISKQETVQFYIDRELNGKVFRLNNSCSPIDKEKVIVIVKNETEYFETKKALEESNNKLVEKNNKLEEYLEKNNKLERFAYILSHDFKEPMRSISGFSELLQKKHAEKFDEESMQYIKFINTGINNMNKMLDGIIQYSQLDEEQFSYEEIDLAQIIDNVKLRLKNIFEDNKAEIAVVSKLPVAKCNKKQMITVFENLITNSIQNTVEKPKIKIDSSKQKNNYLIEVSDNGIGIEESKNEEVFKMFKKLGNTNNSGMGLAICKKIIENHGGEIWVDKNQESNGTTIKFTIPA